MDSEKDKKVKRIARFLELGGTMLAEHCNNCGAPKFRYQGRVICPICDVQEEEEEKRVEEVKEIPVSPEKTPVSPQNPPVSGPAPESQPVSASNSKTGSSAGAAPEKEPWFAKKEGPHVGVRETVEEAFSKSEAASMKKDVRKAEITSLSETLPETLSESGWAGKELEVLLFRKLIGIADSLQEEKDPRRIDEDFGLIEKGLTLIERLKKI